MRSSRTPRLYIVLNALLLITAVVAILLFFNSQYKNLFRLEIKSNIRDIDDIKAALDKYQIEYPWSVDVNEIRNKLMVFNKFKDISVKVSLPNTLYIRAIGRKPYATFWNYKEFFIIDSEGVIISNKLLTDQQQRNMLVSGSDVLQNMSEVVGITNTLNRFTKVFSIRFVGRRRWDVVVANGVQVKLPEKNTYDALLIFEKIFKTHLISSNCIVDMRLVPEKIFIKKSI